MFKKAITNALLAAAYIVAIVLVMFYMQRITPSSPTVLVPIAMISLFTLSAAVMGYLFVYAPATLYLDGKKKDALQLFFWTVGIFAAMTLAFFVVLLVLA